LNCQVAGGFRVPDDPRQVSQHSWLVLGEERLGVGHRATA